MAFPALVPTQRAFDPGNFPVKAYQAQNGTEVRFLYGDKRIGMALSLTYANISDGEAQSFIQHFHQMQGTYQQFLLGEGSAGAKGGWAGDYSWIGAEFFGSRWRYKEAPKLQSVFPGVSTVQVELVAATV